MAEIARPCSFSRRSFIAGAATLTAAGALVGCSPNKGDKESAAPAGGQEEIFPGVCSGNCFGGCYLNVHVRDGRVVRTTARDLPDNSYKRICARGVTHVGRMYSAKRLQYPMRRIGERGSGEFERITWDEAISEIATKWKAIVDEHGPAGFGIMAGSGSYMLANGCLFGGDFAYRPSAYGFLANMTRATLIAKDIDKGTNLGPARATGGIGLTNNIADRKNAKTIVIWGNNPGYATPHSMHFYTEAKRAGAKLIVIDPVFNATASKADWWLPIKAATDGALAMGILNALASNGWLDEGLLRDKTNCPFLIKEETGTFLRMSDLGVEPDEDGVDSAVVWDAASDSAVANGDAVDPVCTGITEVEGFAVRTVYDDAMAQIAVYTPEYASEICGIAAEDIVELARVYAQEGPVATESNLSYNHYKNAPNASWLKVLVPLLTDNVGKSGSGYGVANAGAIMNVVDPAVSAPADGSTASRGIPANAYQLALEGYFAEDGTYLPEGGGVPLKGALIHGCNFMSTDTDREFRSEWVNGLDFMATMDMYMTETCLYSDIVLPSSHWFEREDVGGVGTHCYSFYNAQAVEPLGESKSDYEIFRMIAEGMGYGDLWPETALDYIRLAISDEALDACGITFDDLLNGAVISAETPLVASTEATSLEGGRISLYNEFVTPEYDYGQEIDESLEHSIQFVEDSDMCEGSEARQKYPFHMMSEKMRTHTHTQWCDCEFVKEYEPEPIARFNPADADELGIADGDIVKLYNDKGYVVIKAAMSAGVPPKTITYGRSWNEEDYIDGHVANMSSKEFNQIVRNQCYNDVVCAVEKA